MGRWKNGPQGAYYDPNDSGPDQVAPPMGQQPSGGQMFGNLPSPGSPGYMPLPHVGVPGGTAAGVPIPGGQPNGQPNLNVPGFGGGQGVVSNTRVDPVTGATYTNWTQGTPGQGSWSRGGSMSGTIPGVMGPAGGNMFQSPIGSYNGGSASRGGSYSDRPMYGNLRDLASYGIKR